MPHKANQKEKKPTKPNKKNPQNPKSKQERSWIHNLVCRRLVLIWYLARSLLIRKEFYHPEKGVIQIEKAP